MLRNILNIYCKNIFNNFLIAESCRVPHPHPSPETHLCFIGGQATKYIETNDTTSRGLRLIIGYRREQNFEMFVF